MQQNKKLIFSLLLISTVVISIVLFSFKRLNDTHSNTRAEMISPGWLSGAACVGVADGSFASWRGSPVPIAGMWSDTGFDSQKEQWSLRDEYENWTGSIDDSIGAFWNGTWADAANGAYDSNWKAALNTINTNWGNKKTIFIRFAHEFNGSWYQWKVRPEDNEDFKRAFARFYNLVQTELVSKGRDAKVVWSPNLDEHNGMNTELNWPGDQYVDVVGVDFYDWDRMTNQTIWDQNFNKRGNYGGPAGIGSWQAFAKSHGKPISFPEWGNAGDGPFENPFFIQKMNEFFRANAGTGPGQVWYDVFFNCSGYNTSKGEIFQFYPTTALPQSAAMYKSLKWGDGGVITATPIVQQPTNTPVVNTQPSPTALPNIPPTLHPTATPVPSSAGTQPTITACPTVRPVQNVRVSCPDCPK